MFGMPGRRLIYCSVLAAWPLQAIGQTAPGQPAPSAETTATIAAPAVLNYLARQSASQRLATSFIGKNVYDPDGQKIGDVSDVVLDTQTAQPRRSSWELAAFSAWDRKTSPFRWARFGSRTARVDSTSSLEHRARTCAALHLSCEQN